MSDLRGEVRATEMQAGVPEVPGDRAVMRGVDGERHSYDGTMAILLASFGPPVVSPRFQAPGCVALSDTEARLRFAKCNDHADSSSHLFARLDKAGLAIAKNGPTLEPLDEERAVLLFVELRRTPDSSTLWEKLHKRGYVLVRSAGQNQEGAQS